MMFKNRIDAGKKLAKDLKKEAGPNVQILALARGGVPVAAQVAEGLKAPLEVLLVRKIGTLFNAELGIGALCEDAEPYFDEQLIRFLDLEAEKFDEVVRRQREEIKRQKKVFRKGRALPSLKNKEVILVDDGLATGSTMTAAIQYVANHEAKKIIVALPVAATQACQELRRRVSEVRVLNERSDLRAVGRWYEAFEQVEDEEVLRYLEQARHPEQSAPHQHPP